MIGNFSHLFCSSVDFVSESHFVQLVDPFSVLTVPFGHFIHAVPATWRVEFPPGTWQTF